MKHESRGPLLVALVLLLLPVLYLSSYLALVKPGMRLPTGVLRSLLVPPNNNYRCGGGWSQRVFWPLEQIDRKLRPEAWERIAVSYHGVD